MARRFHMQKPDPTIQRNIVRARRTPPAGTGQGWVVGASLAATLAAAALFAWGDVPQATAQAPAVALAVTAAAQPTDSPAGPVTAGLAGLWAAWTGGASGANPATADATPAATPGSTPGVAPSTGMAALATTRASR